jgi:hypothetical protein
MFLVPFHSQQVFSRLNEKGKILNGSSRVKEHRNAPIAVFTIYQKTMTRNVSVPRLTLSRFMGKILTADQIFMAKLAKAA